MRVNGKMIKLTAWATICTRMAPPTTESGRTTSSTETELKLGLMERAMKALTMRARNTAEELSNLLMAVSTLEISNIMKSLGEESTSGQTGKHTMDSGRRIKCTATESSRGRTAKDMKATS
jgi:hypothetical protein